MASVHEKQKKKKNGSMFEQTRISNHDGSEWRNGASQRDQGHLYRLTWGLHTPSQLHIHALMCTNDFKLALLYPNLLSTVESKFYCLSS